MEFTMGNQSLLDNVSCIHAKSKDSDERVECRDGSDKERSKELGEHSFSADSPNSPACGLVNINANRFGAIIGKSPAIRRVFRDISRTAPSKASVVIYGESGTGKEMAAQAIHNLSPRRNKRFVPVNCSAIPAELIESEFFGYKKGAFTGATMDKQGLLDLAEGGTLFLDEVCELSTTMQVKLLRAIDGGGFTPIGSQVIKKPDFRIIAATNRELRDDVNKGLMREDFYYRINILPIHLPSLRERREDVPLLINHFLARFCPDQVIPIIPSDLMAMLERYDWPGNIRELQNTIQRYIAMNEIDWIGSASVAHEGLERSLFKITCDRGLKSVLGKFEENYIAQCLKAMDWHMGKTCAVLKINRKTLYKKIQQYGLKKMSGV